MDQLYDPIYWLRLVAAKHVLELPQQRSSLLELRRVIGTPRAPSTADAAEVEPEEAEALASAEVHVSTLLLIDLDLQIGQLLPEAFLHRPHKPVMARVGIDQDHQIVGKTRVLDVGEPAAACHLLRPLEHPVHLGEIEVAE